MSGRVSRERWLQISSLLDEILDLPEGRRREHLDRACVSEPDLKQDVLAYLVSGEGAGGFLDGSPTTDLETASCVSGPGADSSDGTPPEAEGADGRMIGPYRLTRQIGRGGMGVVYLARRADGQFDKEVALKLVRRGLDTEEILTRFRRERQILARLEHPHIARLLDGGISDDGRPYLVMEHVQGDPITRWCDARRSAIGERLRLFRDVCETVQYAHRNLVVHRDLKPSNILVSDDGQVKLLDFGIAKLLAGEGEAGAATLTRTGLRPMTPEYAAPEQALDAPLTTAADVYSLGVVLYELLAGRRPRGSVRTETGEIRTNESDAGPAPPSRSAQREDARPEADGPPATSPAEIARRRGTTPDRLSRRLKGDLDTIALKALQRDPARRYRTAEALVEDLDRHRDGLPIRARRDTWGYRAGKFLTRHRWGAAAGLLVTLSLAAGMAGTLWQSRQARREAAKAREVKDFTLSLFKVSDPRQSRAKDLTARDLLDAGARRVDLELRGQPAVQAEMMQLLGRVYATLGDYDRGRSLLERALDLERRTHGRDDAEFAATLHDLGALLSEKGDYAEAERTLRQALALQERLLGPEDAALGSTLTNLGDVLSGIGRFEEAEAVYRRALAINRSALGEEHLEVAMNLSDLGTLLYSHGRYPEAEDLFLQALRIRESRPDSDDYDTDTVRHNYAGALAAEGEIERAEPLLRQVLLSRRQSLGADHSYVAVSLDVLGILLQDKGEYEESAAMLQEALDIRRRTQGPDSPDVGKSLNNLALLQYRRGDLSEARRLYEQSLAVWKKRYSEGHPNVLAARNGLGMVLGEAGDTAQAESLLRDVLARRLALLGEESLQVAQSRFALGSLLARQSEVDEGEQMLRSALATRQKKLGAGHFSVAAVQASLAGLLRDRGRLEESRDLYQEVLVVDRKVFSKDGPPTADALVGLGRTLLAQHKAPEAEPLLREGLAIRRASLVRNDPRTAEAQVALGCSLVERGKSDEAARLLADALPILERRPPALESLVGAGRSALARIRGTRP